MDTTQPAPAPVIRSRFSRPARGLLIAVLILLALVIIIRAVLDPLAARATRKELSQLQGMKGDFSGVHVTVFAPGYTITHLKLIQTPGGDWREPLFYAQAIHVGLDWRQLLHRRLVASARIVEPKVTVLTGVAARPSEKKPPPKPPDISAQLQAITPFKVERVEIVRGEFLFRDQAEPRQPELWAHKVELAMENLPTRPALSGGRPTTLSARGVIGKSGELTLFATADPFAHPLAFAGRCEMVGLRAAELFDFVEPKAHLQTPTGTVDLFAEFKVRDGMIDASVKPVLKNIHVRPVEDSVWNRLRAWVADTAVKLASDRVPDRNAVASTVPIRGRLTDPDVQLLPAVLGVVRNAFVEGLASGFARLPPPQAPEKEGLWTQVKNAVSKSSNAPKAQPAGRTPAGKR